MSSRPVMSIDWMADEGGWVLARAQWPLSRRFLTARGLDEASLSTGVIAGIVVAAVVAFLLIVALGAVACVCCGAKLAGKQVRTVADSRGGTSTRCLPVIRIDCGVRREDRL